MGHDGRAAGRLRNFEHRRLFGAGDRRRRRRRTVLFLSASDRHDPRHDRAWVRGLAFRSGVGVVIAVLSLVVVLARIRAEERLLSESFGAEYDAYRARTWRLIPHVY